MPNYNLIKTQNTFQTEYFIIPGKIFIITVYIQKSSHFISSDWPCGVQMEFDWALKVKTVGANSLNTELTPQLQFCLQWNKKKEEGKIAIKVLLGQFDFEKCLEGTGLKLMSPSHFFTKQKESVMNRTQVYELKLSYCLI